MKNNFVQIIENYDPLVRVSEKDFILEPVYFNNGIAPNPDIFIRQNVLYMLLSAKKNLPTGMNFKIWDGYRILKVQKKLYDDLWELRQSQNPEWSSEKLKIEVEKFVGLPSFDPFSPSQHNTGGAVDLTIVRDDHAELKMGTDFDEFHERSYAHYFDSLGDRDSKAFSSNRALLKNILCDAGFAPYEWEWWHFAFGNQHWAKYYGKDVAIYGSMEL